MNNIDTELIGLDRNALHSIAAWHDKQAQALRERAKRIEGANLANDDNRRRLRSFDDLHKYVINQLKLGHSLPDAILRTAAQIDAPVNTVKVYWKKFVKAEDKKTLAERNAFMLHMAGIGTTNANIGALVNMHPNSVSRVLSKERKKSIFQFSA
jgi:hypothetical protein